MCGLLTHDCRRPDGPPGWHTTAIWHNGKGEGEVDGLTLQHLHHRTGDLLL